MNQREVGTRQESRAAEYLESLGYHILVRNFRCRFGEIDLIAKQDDTYIFIEVKYRTGRTAGDPTSAVEYQGNGYGSHAIALVEAEIKKYSESVYLEVAARNFGAMKLYHRLGYHCLNTVTLRKDFQPENFEVIRSEELLGYPLEVKKYIK